MNRQDTSAEFQTPACSQYEAALEDYVNGEFADAETTKLTEHLKTCSGCASVLAEAQVSARLLRAAEPTADPGVGFSRNAMARIRMEMETMEEKSIWRPFVSLAWKLSATAAVALVLLVTFDVKQHNARVDQNELAIMASNETPELLSDEARLPSTRDEILLMMAEGGHAKH